MGAKVYIGRTAIERDMTVKEFLEKKDLIRVDAILLETKEKAGIIPELTIEDLETKYINHKGHFETFEKDDGEDETGRPYYITKLWYLVEE